MFSPYYGLDEYEGDYLAREAQEEYDARCDYLSEAYGATARDAAACAEQDYEADEQHDAHVWDFLVERAKSQAAALPPWHNDDIPF